VGAGTDFSFLKAEKALVVYVLLASLIAKISLFRVPGYGGDLAIFAAWFNAAAQHGPLVFYQVTYCDYPPFNVYIFWTFGSLAKWLSLLNASSPILKLPSTLFDTATAGLIFIFLRKRLSFDTSLIATTFYAFNPATIFNASIWGQFDAIYTFFLILSIVFILDSKPKLSVAAFTAAVLTKPQSIALAPLIIFLLVRKHSLKTVAASVATSTVLIFTVSAPVSLDNLANFLVNIYLRGYQEYAYTSANAFNLWGLVGLWKSDAQTLLFLNFFQIGWIMFGTLAVSSLYYLYRAMQRAEKTGYTFEMAVLFTAFVLLFGFFMLPTRIHERYLFPVISVLTMMLPFIEESRPLYAVLSITYLANMWYVLQFLNAGNSIPAGDPVVYVISSINLAALVYVLLVMIRKQNMTTTSIPVQPRMQGIQLPENEPK
jgi:Gpi18-like mannosyltransferase